MSTEPKLGPAEGGEVNSLMDSAQYDLESGFGGVSLPYEREKHAAQLAEALWAALAGLIEISEDHGITNQADITMAREALARWEAK